MILSVYVPVLLLGEVSSCDFLPMPLQWKLSEGFHASQKGSAFRIKNCPLKAAVIIVLSLNVWEEYSFVFLS